MSITADVFCREFGRAWESRRHLDPNYLLSCYVDDRRWTELMLGKDGVIEQTFNSIKALPQGDSTLQLRREWYTVDALFVGGEDLFRGHMSYPSRIEAIIEHENGDAWEEEMWKLLFFRAPLKILIGYDVYDEDYLLSPRRGAPGKTKGDWLPDKLKALRSMHEKVNVGLAEEGTEYLLLVGNRATRDDSSEIKWRWCRIDQPDQAMRELQHSA